jgi:hypothetical protein
MRPASLLNALVNVFIPSKRPVLLYSSPGLGKSSIVKQAAAALGIGVIDLRGSLLDPVDLRGVPTIENGVTRWCAPEFLPRDGKGILFLDELGQSAPAVQASFLQLALDRACGEYKLPDGWAIVAASNNSDDRAGVNKLISPLLNRFVHIDLEVSADDWQAWAAVAGIRPEVRAYIKSFPTQLNTFKAAKESGSIREFATPRTWEFVSQLFPVTPEDDRMEIFSGAVGRGVAGEFMGYLKNFEKMPDVDSVISDPLKTRIPEDEASVMYALIMALSAKLRDANQTCVEADNTKNKQKLDEATKNRARIGAALPQYAGRFKSHEYSTLLMKEAITAWRAIHTLKEMEVWLDSPQGQALASLDDVFKSKKK